MESLGWLIPLLAVVEAVGGILVAIPRTRALCTAVLLPVMVGSVAAHLYLAEGVVFAIAIAAVHGWIVASRYQNYKALWSK